MDTIETSVESAPVFNRIVRDHEVSVEWQYRELAEKCHLLFGLVNGRHFSGMLQVCYLQMDRANRKKAGHSRSGQNAVGAEYEILLNTKNFYRPLKEVLATLLHNMVHQWQDQQQPDRQNVRRYHNTAFVEKCAEIGIACESGYKCSILSYEDAFLALLREAGLDPEAPALEDAIDDGEQPSSKQKKWRCLCTNIRSAVPVYADCRVCGQPFALVTG